MGLGNIFRRKGPDVPTPGSAAASAQAALRLQGLMAESEQQDRLAKQKQAEVKKLKAQLQKDLFDANQVVDPANKMRQREIDIGTQQILAEGRRDRAKQYLTDWRFGDGHPETVRRHNVAAATERRLGRLQRGEEQLQGAHAVAETARDTVGTYRAIKEAIAGLQLDPNEAALVAQQVQALNAGLAAMTEATNGINPDDDAAHKMSPEEILNQQEKLAELERYVDGDDDGSMRGDPDIAVPPKP